MNLPFNNLRAGVTLLETLVMLAVMALVMSLAASGFQGGNRSVGLRGISAEISKEIALARNQALRSSKETTLPFSTLARSLANTSLELCNTTDAPMLRFFPDGTVYAPDICITRPTSGRIRIDWLTGRPAFIVESRTDE